ncbi:MAG TPA: hypothetical protein VMU83_06200 [Hanamia sp.]|nr:hypothetical protein [Hanamia sp.]
MAKKTYIKRIALGIILLIVLALVTVYIWSTVILNKAFSAPLTEVHIPNDSASLREGARLAHIAHCGDCHGAHFSGGIGFKVNHVVEFVCPNITGIIPTYSMKN